MSFSYYH